MKLSHETLKAILVPVPPKEDSRGFLVRLLSSLQFWAKGKRGHDGKITVFVGVRGGADF
jgi:hypothetical protein